MADIYVGDIYAANSHADGTEVAEQTEVIGPETEVIALSRSEEAHASISQLLSGYSTSAATSDEPTMVENAPWIREMHSRYYLWH